MALVLAGLFVLGAGAWNASQAADHAALIDAVKQNDLPAVRRLLREGADVNATEVDGTTALHWAAYRNNLEAGDLLIRAGAKAHTANRYGVAPLSLACTHGNAAFIERLLDAGADAKSAQPSGETALMTAARAGRVEAVKVLLTRGADVNARETWKGQTALMWAAAEDHAAVVEALIAGGAEVNARTMVSPDLTPNEPGDKGFTALLFAARAGRIDAARALLAKGANVNDTLTADGTSALVLAVTSAQFEMAVFLLDKGADPNAAANGWSALHQMAWTRRPNRGNNTIPPVPRGRLDSLTFVKVLVERGADLNARVTKEPVEIYVGRNILNRIGATPFLLAAHRGDVELMRLLVSLGADPLLPNKDGTTPLMVAAGVGLWFPGESPGTPDEAADAVKLCLELGGDPNAVDYHGDTALHGAAYWDSPRAVELLVAAGAKLDATNKRGWTALTVADGVTITASLHAAPATATLLRRLMKERELPVPDPGVGQVR